MSGMCGENWTAGCNGVDDDDVVVVDADADDDDDDISSALRHLAIWIAR